MGLPTALFPLIVRTIVEADLDLLITGLTAAEFVHSLKGITATLKLLLTN